MKSNHENNGNHPPIATAGSEEANVPEEQDQTDVNEKFFSAVLGVQRGNAVQMGEQIGSEGDGGHDSFVNGRMPHDGVPEAAAESADAELWPGVSCQVRVVGSSLVIDFGESAWQCVFKLPQPEISQECGQSLTALVAGAVSEVSGMAYQMGRRDAKEAMFAAV